MLACLSGNCGLDHSGFLFPPVPPLKQTQTLRSGLLCPSLSSILPRTNVPCKGVGSSGRRTLPQEAVGQGWGPSGESKSLSTLACGLRIETSATVWNDLINLNKERSYLISQRAPFFKMGVVVLYTHRFVMKITLNNTCQLLRTVVGTYEIHLFPRTFT